jgi:hypothetical protein
MNHDCSYTRREMVVLGEIIHIPSHILYVYDFIQYIRVSRVSS